jgi:hypothetical protein
MHQANPMRGRRASVYGCAEECFAVWRVSYRESPLPLRDFVPTSVQSAFELSSQPPGALA